MNLYKPHMIIVLPDLCLEGGDFGPVWSNLDHFSAKMSQVRVQKLII